MNLLDRIEDMLTTMGKAISRSNARPSGMNENTRTSESKSLGHTSKLSPSKSHFPWTHKVTAVKYKAPGLK